MTPGKDLNQPIRSNILNNHGRASHITRFELPTPLVLPDMNESLNVFGIEPSDSCIGQSIQNRIQA